MKKTMKKLAVFVMMVAIAIFIAVATATAGDEHQKTIYGKYAVTGEDACLYSPLGFNADLTPRDGWWSELSSIQGVKTFNPDGTGSVQGCSVSLSIASPLTSAASENFQNSFTYTIGPDHTITQQSSSPMTLQVLTGPWAGVTCTIDKIAFKGMFSKNYNSYTMATVEPQIETITYSNGYIFPRICQRSRVGIRLPDNEEHR
jgi:hypothetical protein